MVAAGRARRGGDPEIGRAGVEVDGEALGRLADGDLAGPEEIILLVGEFDATALLEGLGESSQRLDLSALGERLAADVLLEVDEVLAMLAANGGGWSGKAMSGIKEAMYFFSLTISRMAASRLKVPSAFCRLPRFWRGMRTLPGVMGVAEAMRARATVKRVALQNMVGDETTGVVEIEGELG